MNIGSDYGSQSQYDYSSYCSQDYNQQNQNQTTQKLINQHVYNEILNENIVGEIMHEELNHVPELSIDQWNEEYIQLLDELNQYLAKKLLETCNNDEAINYQRNTEFTKLQTEQMAQMYDPNNNSFYICAICKRYVYRISPTQIQCERPGCLDMDLRSDDFKLEDLMNMIMRVLIDHKQQCEEQSIECCPEDKHMKVKCQLLSECGLNENDDGVQDSLAIFLTCDKCNYFDFVSIS